MIMLPDVAVDAQIYSSKNSVVYRGIKLSDRTPVILKVLKQDYPTASELTRYRQEYEITRSHRKPPISRSQWPLPYFRMSYIALQRRGPDAPIAI